MGDLLGLAGALIRSSLAIADGLESEGIHKALKILQDESKSAIGTYRYGWAPLAESTLEKKAADTPLLDTGEMQQSIQIQAGHGEGWVYTNDHTFVFHEWGTSKMPARPVFRNALAHKGQEAADAIGKDVSAHILRK